MATGLILPTSSSSGSLLMGGQRYSPSSVRILDDTSDPGTQGKLLILLFSLSRKFSFLRVRISVASPEKHSR